MQAAVVSHRNHTFLFAFVWGFRGPKNLEIANELRLGRSPDGAAVVTLELLSSTLKDNIVDSRGRWHVNFYYAQDFDTNLPRNVRYGESTTS